MAPKGRPPKLPREQQPIRPMEKKKEKMEKKMEKKKEKMEKKMEKKKEKKKLPPLNWDPYVLAYRFEELKRAKPKRWRDRYNPYYESLLANQPDPPEGAQDAYSRAIRYAKEHYEDYYEPRHVEMIVEILDRQTS